MNSTGFDLKIFLVPKSYRAFRETGRRSVQSVDICYRRVFHFKYILTFSIAKPVVHIFVLNCSVRISAVSGFLLTFLVILNGRLDIFKRVQSFSDAF